MLSYKNIRAKWSAMPSQRKFYVIFWILTGVFLITLIGMFVGLDQKSGEREDGGKWSYKNDDAKLSAAIESGAVSTGFGPKTIPVTLKSGVTPPQPAPTVLTLEGVAGISNAKALYDINQQVNHEIYDWDKFNPGPYTPEARSAQDALAAVGFVFLITLTTAVFSTVIVEYMVRRRNKEMAEKVKGAN